MEFLFLILIYGVTKYALPFSQTVLDWAKGVNLLGSLSRRFFKHGGKQNKAVSVSVELPETKEGGSHEYEILVKVTNKQTGS